MTSSLSLKMCVSVCVYLMSIRINVWMDVHENVHSGFLWVLRNISFFFLHFNELSVLFYNK